MSKSERTRQRILEATRQLLDERPSGLLSMAEIAQAAGVTRQLLYVHFDNRTALLVELSRLLDVDARTPALQATIDDAPDAVAALRAAVKVQAAIKPKIHGWATSLEHLAPSDEAAAAVIEEREAMRLGRCREVVDRLAREGCLAEGWTRPAAAELLWSMTSLRAWEDLVHRREWSTATWVTRTTAALESALVAVRT